MSAPAIGRVLVKPGVQFTLIAPAGFRLLSSIDYAARMLALDVTITSACDGAHSGPADPHHRGEAYDIRTHGLAPDQADTLLAVIINACRGRGEPMPQPADGVARSLATGTFFGFVELPGTDNEHLHVQLRKGARYGE